MLDYCIVEKVIAHREKKGSGDAIRRCEQRNAILFSPVAIFDEGRIKVGGNQLSHLVDHALAFKTDYEVHGFDPGMNQGIQGVRYQGSATHRDKWLQKSFI